MKNNILIGVFVSFIALFSLTNSSNRFNKINQKVSPYDTIKVMDTTSVDTVDFSVVMHQENAYASYYSDKLTGRKTASGAIFDNNKLTCAHKTLPFGTRLKITSIKTGKSVNVTVTDRGPFVKGRHIDLSKKAFMKITPNKHGGHIRVNIEIIQE
jgi:rare lipoprotein A